MATIAASSCSPRQNLRAPRCQEISGAEGLRELPGHTLGLRAGATLPPAGQTGLACELLLIARERRLLAGERCLVAARLAGKARVRLGLIGPSAEQPLLGEQRHLILLRLLLLQRHRLAGLRLLLRVHAGRVARPLVRRVLAARRVRLGRNRVKRTGIARHDLLAHERRHVTAQHRLHIPRTDIVDVAHAQHDQRVAVLERHVLASVDHRLKIDGDVAPGMGLLVRGHEHPEKEIRVGQKRRRADEATQVGRLGQRADAGDGDMPVQAHRSDRAVALAQHHQHVAEMERELRHRGRLGRAVAALIVEREFDEAIAARTQRRAGKTQDLPPVDGPAREQLVDAGAVDLAGDGNGGPDRRDDDAVAVADAEIGLRPAVIHDAVEIDPRALAAADHRDVAQRSGLFDPAGHRQGIERRGKSTHAIHARRNGFAKDGDGDLPHGPDRHEHIGVEEAGSDLSFKIAPDFAETAAGGRNRRKVRHDEAAFAVDPRAQRARHLSFERDDELVADAEAIIVRDGAVLQLAVRGNEAAEHVISVLREGDAGTARIIGLELRACERKTGGAQKLLLLLQLLLLLLLRAHLIERREQHLAGIDGNIALVGAIELIDEALRKVGGQILRGGVRHRRSGGEQQHRRLKNAPNGSHYSPPHVQYYSPVEFMASPVPIARRIFLVGAATMLCAGCGDTWLKNVRFATKTYLMKGDDLKLTRADIDRIPYASVAARLGDGPQVLLILGKYDGDDLHWISHESEVIVTRRGRVVQTYGLPDDLKETQFLTADPVGRPEDALRASAECLRTIDLEPQHIDGVLVRSRFEGGQSEALTILGAEIATSVWTEASAAPDLAWQFRNHYWIEPRTGYVWKSVQYLSPKLPPLELIIFRPAAPA